MGDEEQAQAILSRLSTLKEQRQMIISKITELDGEHTEHNLVISTLEPLPPERRCFRMIGEVLVERNNAEVLQAVIQNRDNVRRAQPGPCLCARLPQGAAPRALTPRRARAPSSPRPFTVAPRPAAEKGDGGVCGAPQGQGARAA